MPNSLVIIIFSRKHINDFNGKMFHIWWLLLMYLQKIERERMLKEQIVSLLFKIFNFKTYTLFYQFQAILETTFPL